MIWLGVEPLVAGNPALALERAGRSAAFRCVARFIARRGGATPTRSSRSSRRSAGRRRPGDSLLEGMRDGLEGRVDLAASVQLAAASRRG